MPAWYIPWVWIVRSLLETSERGADVDISYRQARPFCCSSEHAFFKCGWESGETSDVATMTPPWVYREAGVAVLAKLAPKSWLAAELSLGRSHLAPKIMHECRSESPSYIHMLSSACPPLVLFAMCALSCQFGSTLLSLGTCRSRRCSFGICPHGVADGRCGFGAQAFRSDAYAACVRCTAFVAPFPGPPVGEGIHAWPGSSRCLSYRLALEAYPTVASALLLSLACGSCSFGKSMLFRIVWGKIVSHSRRTLQLEL